MRVLKKSSQPSETVGHWYASVPELALAHFDCDRAGVALKGPRGAVITLAASDALVEEADRLQAAHADGPAMTRAWSVNQVAVDDVAHGAPWPSWASAVAELGVRGVLATQIVTPEGATGALTLYYEHPVRFADHELELARALAHHVASEIHHVLTAARLAVAVEARARIGQTQGMLMEKFGLTADDAMEVLQQHSLDTNTRLQDIADRLVETHDLDGLHIDRRRR